MPKSKSFLAKAFKNVTRGLKGVVAPFMARKRRATRKSRKSMVKRGGGSPKRNTTLRANAPEFSPYAHEYPALPKKGKNGVKSLKKGEIWPANKNYKYGKGSAALKGGATRRARHF